MLISLILAFPQSISVAARQAHKSDTQAIPGKLILVITQTH